MKKIFLCVLFAAVFFNTAHAEEKETEKPNIHEITRDVDKELNTVFKNKVLDFFPVKENYPEFFQEVKKQIPPEAELLEVYLPSQSRQDLERDHFDNILNVVYFYRMPQILHKRIPLQKLQLSFVRESLEAVYESFAKVEPPTLADRKEWEEKMYNNLLEGKNVYVRYKRAIGALDHRYSLMLVLPLSDSYNLAMFMSHYLFISEGQIYFLSSSAYLLDNNYYKTMQWTRQVLNDFIEVIPLDFFPDNE